MVTLTFPETAAVSSGPPKATIRPAGFGELIFDVAFGDELVWRVDAFSAEGLPLLLPQAVVRPHELLVGGEPVVWSVGDFPEQAATLAVEEAMRLLWPTPLRTVLLAAGFSAAPSRRTSTTGRRAGSDAELVVRARRALGNPHRANEEKLLTRTRERGLLQRPPKAREFTRHGRDLLGRVDRAAVELLQLLQAQGGAADAATFGSILVNTRGFSVDVVNAAMDSLVARREIRIVEPAGDRARHRFAALRVQLRDVG